MVRLRGLFADTTPLANPHFRRLWRANIITVIGAQLTVVAVPAQIYAITGSSAYVGLTGLFGLVPLIVFGLWGGALADHFDRRKLLLVSTVGLIATSAAFWAQAALQLDGVWLLLGLFALQQAFFAINQPTRTAILPRLLPNAQLPAANALNMTVMMAGAIAGPLVGGMLIPVLGYSWLYLVDTLTLFATLAAVWRLPDLPVDRPSGAPGLKSVIAGFVYLRGHPILLTSFLVDLIAMVFGMPRALFPEIAHVNFGGPAEGGPAFALLYAAIPAGAVLGGVFSGWVSTTHLGIELDIPAVGVGKSRLIGTWSPPAMEAGSFSSLCDGEEEIGSVLRTRQGVKPLFISIGHRIDLPSASRTGAGLLCRLPHSRTHAPGGYRGGPRQAWHGPQHVTEEFCCP